MLVYRVENEERKGPYVSDRWSADADKIGLGYWDMIESHRDKYTHPNTIEDDLDTSGTDRWHHAFPSLDMFEEWFLPKWRLALALSGYALVKYDVQYPDYRLGFSGKQVIFKKEKAEFVDCQPLIF